MLSGHHMLRACGPRPIIITISANAYDVNWKALAGNPSGAVQSVLVIAPGVRIGSANPLATYSLRTGGFAAGSYRKLINNGSINGHGGQDSYPAGGDAIYLDEDVEIDNAGGEIFGGGGSGAWGFPAGTQGGLNATGGGGSGGGQGFDGGAGGLGDSAGAGWTEPGSDGNPGGVASPGIGGQGGSNGFYGTHGGTGGTGGTWGQPGSVSSANSNGQTNTSVGAAGYAVRRNGHSITWVGGYNAAQVKGVVA